MPELKTGDQAPDFALPDQHGVTHRLRDYAGRTVLIYFYPRASTPGCTTQSCAVRDARADWAARGVAALGISPDDTADQRRFDESYGLGFPLLADTDHAVAEAYGVWGEKTMYGRTSMGIIRSAFLIDGAGRVAKAWYRIAPKDTVPSVDEALNAAKP